MKKGAMKPLYIAFAENQINADFSMIVFYLLIITWVDT
jgi:hypothetical protein